MRRADKRIRYSWNVRRERPRPQLLGEYSSDSGHNSALSVVTWIVPLQLMLRCRVSHPTCWVVAFCRTVAERWSQTEEADGSLCCPLLVVPVNGLPSPDSSAKRRELRPCSCASTTDSCAVTDRSWGGVR